MKNNKKGAALMQVLLITIILAGICTMLLRASLSRTTSARKTRRTVSGQVLIQSCMAEINTLWSKKSPEKFTQDLANGVMYTNAAGENQSSYTCSINHGGTTVRVQASMRARSAVNGSGYDIVYEVLDSDVL